MLTTGTLPSLPSHNRYYDMSVPTQIVSKYPSTSTTTGYFDIKVPNRQHFFISCSTSHDRYYDFPVRTQPVYHHHSTQRTIVPTHQFSRRLVFWSPPRRLTISIATSHSLATSISVFRHSSIVPRTHGHYFIFSMNCAHSDGNIPEPENGMHKHKRKQSKYIWTVLSNSLLSESMEERVWHTSPTLSIFQSNVLLGYVRDLNYFLVDVCCPD